MTEQQIKKPVCRSVFKGGRNTTSKSQFTKKWIELVNGLEKNKEFVGGKQ